MSMKNFSMVGKLVIFGFLVMFLMAISYQPAFAASEEVVVSKKYAKVSISAGFTDDGGGCGNGIIWIGPLPRPIIYVGVEVGYNSFKVDPGLNDLTKKFYWLNANPTIRVTFGKSNLRPFISSGPGIYFPKGGKARLGFKGNLGLEYQLSESFSLEMSSDYHYIFLKDSVRGENTDFFNFHGGIGIIL